ncbi:MAG: hypothetical protein SF187_30895 [Deltaproteobacteria bacterium]|nr:hypothetical protein [Deltaproteobacteria bacterium]
MQKQPKTPAAARTKMVIPPADKATHALLSEALADRPLLRPGKMFGCPGFFLGTKAVAVLFGEDVCITLPQARVQTLIDTLGYRPFIAGGNRAMSGWALISPEQLTDLGSDSPLWDESIAYVKSKIDAAVKAKAAKASKTPTKARSVPRKAKTKGK